MNSWMNNHLIQLTIDCTSPINKLTLEQLESSAHADEYCTRINERPRPILDVAEVKKMGPFEAARE